MRRLPQALGQLSANLGKLVDALDVQQQEKRSGTATDRVIDDMRDVVEEVARLDPKVDQSTTDGGMSWRMCSFCRAVETRGGELHHVIGCLWMRARRLVERMHAL